MYLYGTFRKSWAIGILALMIAGCAGGGGGSSGGGSSPISAVTPVVGRDLSGTYNLIDMVGYSGANALPIVARGLFVNNSPTQRIVISGNSYTLTTNLNGCIATETGRVEFDPIINYRMTNRNVVTTSNNCPGTYEITTNNGTIGPHIWNVNHTTNLMPDINSYFQSESATEVSFRSMIHSQANGNGGWVYYHFVKQ